MQLIKLCFSLSNLISEANTTQESNEAGSDWKGGGGGRSGVLRTPLSANVPMQNIGKVKFDPPKVPVIFVLGNSVNNNNHLPIVNCKRKKSLIQRWTR